MKTEGAPQGTLEREGKGKRRKVKVGVFERFHIVEDALEGESHWRKERANYRAHSNVRVHGAYRYCKVRER